MDSSAIGLHRRFRRRARQHNYHLAGGLMLDVCATVRMIDSGYDEGGARASSFPTWDGDTSAGFEIRSDAFGPSCQCTESAEKALETSP